MEFLKQEHDRVRSCLDRSSQQIQNNDGECRTEENRLNALRKDLHTVRERIRNLESQQEPEPPDVLTFVRFVCIVQLLKLSNILWQEEDLAENQGKLDKQEDLMAEKKRLYEQVNEEYRQAKEEYDQLQSKVGSLKSNIEPSKVSRIFCRLFGVRLLNCDFVLGFAQPNRSKAENLQGQIAHLYIQRGNHAQAAPRIRSGIRKCSEKS